MIMSIRQQVISSTLVSILAITPQLVAGTNFRSVINDPKAYDHKRVTVEGVVIGNGPEFELFETAGDARTITSPSKSFYLVSKDPRSLQSGLYNLRRVRVTGVVDTSLHGTWGNPCGILLEKITALSTPLSAPLIPVAVFRNEESRPIIVRLVGGNPEGEFSIPPKTAVDSPISNGQKIEVTSSDGSLIARGTLRVKKDSPYFDSQTGFFFYRISDKKIEPVLPVSARDWNWRH